MDLMKKYATTVMFLLLLGLALWIIKPFFVSLISASVIAYLAYPLFKFVNANLKNRNISALLVSLTILLIISLPLILIANSLISEATVFYEQGKNILSTTELLQDKDTLSLIRGGLEKFSTTIISGLTKFLVGIPSFIVTLFVTFFLLFFFLRDGYKLVLLAEKILQIKEQHQRKIMKRINEVMYAVVYGNILIALVQGFLGGLGFYLLGINSPILWGATMAIVALLPYFGTSLVWAPASVFLIMQGITENEGTIIAKGIILLIYGTLIVGSVDNILKPKIIGRRSNVHPAIVLLGLFGGLAVFGVIGLIIGPLILAVTLTVIEIYFQEAYMRRKIPKVL